MAKKAKRNMDPNNNANWKLVCSECGDEWPEDETIDLLSGHFQEKHPEMDKPHFNLVWVGIGPRPKRGRRK